MTPQTNMNKPTNIRKSYTRHLNGTFSWEVYVFSGGVFADYSIRSTAHLLDEESLKKDMDKILKHLKLNKIQTI